jgi:kynureninase
MYPSTFQPGEAFALACDAQDPLRGYREQFFIPKRANGEPTIYLCSHSLGLQPRSLPPLMKGELSQWAELGVEGHFHGASPWYTYAANYQDAAARVVGAQANEVVLMNGLTVNLHLMMATFYKPQPGRSGILMEEPTFPSDLYAVKTQLLAHGLDPAENLVCVQPRAGEHVTRIEDVEDLLERRGHEFALVLFNGVNFLTGQVQDMERITRAAHRQGCVVGFDLAHAAGNVILRLHDWQVDFAVWCTYKYLNCGPGAVAGCFVHAMHCGSERSRPPLGRLAGWWGNDPQTRFRMQLEPDFIPQAGAAGWQVSNPPILALVPIRASLALYDEAGMPALRARSEFLTGYLQYLLDRLPTSRIEVITPRAPAERGCQLSMLVHDRPRELLRALEDEGVIADFREPNIIRVSPAPFYNTAHEIRRFSEILRA